MIHFKCQLCRQDITAADQNAGKRAKCPKCQKIIVIPASEPDVEVIEDDSPAEPRPSTAIRKKPETPPPARPRLGGTGPAKKSADDDSDIEELEAVEEDFEVVEEEPEEERPRRSRPTDDDIEHRPPRRRKRRRLPRDDDDEPGNWLDQQFANTNIVVLVLFAFCCGDIALIFGILGVILCKHSLSRRNAIIVLCVSIVRVAVAVMVLMLGQLK